MAKTPAKKQKQDDRQIIRIFDTTLRDGEQAPGNSMNIEEKLRIAKQLQKLNVDVIEAGFPIASDGDFEAVKLVAQTIKGPQIAGLCRSSEKDIDRAWEALKYAGEKGRIHTFIATSDIHMKYKLQMEPAKVLASAVKAVKRAASYTPNVEFSCEDAVRTRLPFLAEVVEAVIAAGATTVNIPDTVGYTIPFEYFNIIKYLKDNVPNIDKAIISVHCHNDLGLSVANSIAAIQAGARQVECTINGIGERAGNCSLEEFVMILRTRGDILPFHHQRRHRAADPGQPPAVHHHRHRGAAQQGRGRGQRLCPRGRHPPARHADGQIHLRDHDPRVGRPVRQRPGAGQALRPPRLQEAPGGTGL